MCVTVTAVSEGWQGLAGTPVAVRSGGETFSLTLCRVSADRHS